MEPSIEDRLPDVLEQGGIQVKERVKERSPALFTFFYVLFPFSQLATHRQF